MAKVVAAFKHSYNFVKLQNYNILVEEEKRLFWSTNKYYK